MWKLLRPSQHGTRNVKTHNRKTQKIKDMTNTDPTKKSRVNSDTCKVYAVPAFYKTPAVLLIYTGRSYKSLGSDRRKKTST